MQIRKKVESKGFKTNTIKKIFKNKNGIFKVGDKVIFEVENQNMWCGDLRGIIIYKGRGKFAIQTERSGLLSIDKGYDVYGNSIRKI